MNPLNHKNKIIKDGFFKTFRIDKMKMVNKGLLKNFNKTTTHRFMGKIRNNHKTPIAKNTVSLGLPIDIVGVNAALPSIVVKTKPSNYSAPLIRKKKLGSWNTVGRKVDEKVNTETLDHHIVQVDEKVNIETISRSITQLEEKWQIEGLKTKIKILEKENIDLKNEVESLQIEKIELESRVVQTERENNQMENKLKKAIPFHIIIYLVLCSIVAGGSIILLFLRYMYFIYTIEPHYIISTLIIAITLFATAWAAIKDWKEFLNEKWHC